jgi:hypothetical protein
MDTPGAIAAGFFVIVGRKGRLSEIKTGLLRIPLASSLCELSKTSMRLLDSAMDRMLGQLVTAHKWDIRALHIGHVCLKGHHLFSRPVLVVLELPLAVTASRRNLWLFQDDIVEAKITTLATHGGCSIHELPSHIRQLPSC